MVIRDRQWARYSYGQAGWSGSITGWTLVIDWRSEFKCESSFPFFVLKLEKKDNLYRTCHNTDQWPINIGTKTCSQKIYHTKILSTLKLGSFKRAIQLNYLDSKDARSKKAFATIRNKLEQEIKRVAQGLGISYVISPANYKYFC